MSSRCELVLHKLLESKATAVSYLPSEAGGDSLWRLRRIQDTQSPWWSSPQRWAGWLPTGREGRRRAWRSFPGSPRARSRPPGSHILPAARKEKVFSLKTPQINAFEQPIVAFSLKREIVKAQKIKREYNQHFLKWDSRQVSEKKTLFPSNPHQRSNSTCGKEKNLFMFFLILTLTLFFPQRIFFILICPVQKM